MFVSVFTFASGCLPPRSVDRRTRGGLSLAGLHPLGLWNIWVNKNWQKSIYHLVDVEGAAAVGVGDVLFENIRVGGGGGGGGAESGERGRGEVGGRKRWGDEGEEGR